MPNSLHMLPMKLEKVLAEIPIDKSFYASDVPSINLRNVGPLISLKQRGLIECLGFKEHEKVKRWQLTAKGTRLADKLREARKQ